MRSVFFLIVLVSVIPKSFSQSVTGTDFNTKFAFEVKSVDDFFDRFNFRSKSSFLKYIEQIYPRKSFSRKDFVVTLFDRSSPSLDINLVKEFVAQTTDSLMPEYISYGDKNWYAELTCKVLYLGNPAKLKLILKVEGSAQKGFSWDIVSAKADFLDFKSVKSDSLILFRMESGGNSSDARDKSYFLSPVSHGFNFSNVDEVFLNKWKINSYIHPGQTSFELNKLIAKIKKSEIKFIQVVTVQYHLLQINGWILKLDYFDRNSINSGWLISKLIKADSKSKNDYKRKYLNLHSS